MMAFARSYFDLGGCRFFNFSKLLFTVRLVELHVETRLDHVSDLDNCVYLDVR